MTLAFARTTSWTFRWWVWT